MPNQELKDGLEHLIERLQAGDDHAAEEIFLRYLPELRLVVRRRMSPSLRSKFDSVDVVQSIWADLLSGFRRQAWSFDTPAKLAAFLVRATSNRFVDRVRTNRSRIAGEVQMGEAIADEIASPTDAPIDQLYADELWDKLWAICPPRHRPVLTLKREGKTLDEIAEATGMHKSSIRRILYNLAKGLNDGDGSGPCGI
jgi:RNA polymerase sigma-70 factor (ECF subfamily)